MKFNKPFTIKPYHIINSAIGFLIFWLATNNPLYATFFGLFEFIYKTIQYNVHEKKIIELKTETRNEPILEQITLKIEEPPIKENEIQKRKVLNYKPNR